MSLALVPTRALVGLISVPVTVEVHLANGLPALTLVGLADQEVREARERVRAALQASGLPFPNNQRITINLAPADLPKDSGRFDLPIALGLLAAAGHIDPRRLQGWVFAGELSLSGALQPVRGALALGLGIRAEGAQAPRLVLPAASAAEAALVPGLAVYAAEHLLDVVQHLSAPADGPEAPPPWTPVQATPGAAPMPGADLADVKGQAQARRALEVAAAGGHNLLMVGPPGSGKSMLAQRLAGLLPPMALEEALESAAIRSLDGRWDPSRLLERPVVACHHSASAVALVGGGNPPRPGEISRAHGGVLFLDELPEFARPALEALREPLETGVIRIARAAHHAQFPARFLMVAAMNPCPCGHWGSAVQRCRCTPEQVERYQGRISGPLLDRIDLRIEVPTQPPAELLQAPAGESTAVVAARCLSAREQALKRQGCTNQGLSGPALDHHATPEPQALALLHKAAERLHWSARSLHRTLRVARTVADLAGSPAIEAPHVAQALQLRRGLAHAA